MKYDGLEFRLTDNFIKKYVRKRPDFGPLGAFVYTRTYSRPTEDGKQENWWQTVKRVVEGCYLVQKRHCKWWNIPWNERQAQKSAQEMYDLIYSFKFLPPGRGLWAMGTNFMFERSSACLYNCGFISTAEMADDFSHPFVWLMDMSMLGVGVGFDTLGAQKAIYLKEPRVSNDVHFVDDSREGWVEVFRRILDAYVGKDTLPKEIDYSKIRPAGSPILGFGGVAPGFDPLRKLADKTKSYLDRYLKEEKPVDSTLIVDLMNFAGEAVVAGGIRRTAELALGSLSDQEFVNLKNQEAITDPSLARWASNNSIAANVGEKYDVAFTHSAVNGEPGFVWLDNCREYGRIIDGKNGKDKGVVGINPCGEITLHSHELCNIVETFPSRHESLEDYKRTLKYAYLYGKTVTLIPTHNARTNAVQFKNRRIGISQTGIIENINRVGFREHIRWCDEGYADLKNWDEVYSNWLCIPRSIKLTTVKPSGSVSLLPGTTPGIHFPHSEYYIRRVRVNKNSPIWKAFQDAGYKVEKDAYEKDHTMVVEVPIHEPYFDRRKDEVSIWEQFELASAIQTYWSDNAVSITITVKPEEAKDLPRALSMYESRLKSVSFLPLAGDKLYKQAPYETITKEQYEEMMKDVKPVKIAELEDEDRVLEKFCDGDVCTLV